MPITKQQIESATVDVLIRQRAVYIYDDSLRGFGVRVGQQNVKYPNSKISYFVEKRAGGRRSKKFRQVFAYYPEMEPGVARNKALHLISQIRDGVDISTKRKELFQKREQELEDYNTKQLKELFDTYIKAKSNGSRYWLRDVPSALRSHVYPWFNATTPVTSIAKADMRAFLRSIKSPSAGLKTTKILQGFFKYLVQEDYIDISPMSDLAYQHQEPDSRNRVLKEKELIAYWRATGEMLSSNYHSTRIFGACFRMLLLTAQRRDEVAGVHYSELDLDKCVWEIPAPRTKNNHPHLVYLAPLAVEVLKTVTRSNPELVFSTTKRTAISGFGYAKRNLDKLMVKYLDGELDGFHLHDLRATFATICAAELKINDDICDRILNHVNGKRSGVKYVYQKYEYWEERKEAMIRWNDYLAGLVGGDQR